VSVKKYLDLGDYIDLDRQVITAASLSDIIRILLLYEYGGVWVDATALCRMPLDRWLPDAAKSGFFAFAAPGPDRLLSSWFLAAAPGNKLVAKWAARTVRYWRDRREADNYFWFHHEFRSLCEADTKAAEEWRVVDKIGADGPHSAQSAGLYTPIQQAFDKIDWSAPVFKLTHRLDSERDHDHSVLQYLLKPYASARTPVGPTTVRNGIHNPMRFASLKVSTENLGDHIQIIASRRLLSRLDIVPELEIDRDDEIASVPQLAATSDRIGIVLNGWFKTNPSEWPPHPRLWPIFVGFHIRLFQAPTLTSPAALEYYRQYGPVGSRDKHTDALLRGYGIDSFVSQCLSIALPRRIIDSKHQTEVFIVSRDERLFQRLRSRLQSAQSILQYSGSSDFRANMERAAELLDLYQSRARLIVTSLLHCALPSIAMGIPTIVFYPLSHEELHDSDRERFSSLADLLPIYRIDDLDTVDWAPVAPDVGELKLILLDRFYELASRWRLSPRRALGPIAPASALPSP